MASYGFDFHAAKRIFDADRLVERWDEGTYLGETLVIVTGLVGSEFISVVYTEHDGRKRIIRAFEADDDDIMEFMMTFTL